MKTEYVYINKSNRFNIVKWDLDGNFIEIDGSTDNETLLKMENMEDITGWEIADEMLTLFLTAND